MNKNNKSLFINVFMSAGLSIVVLLICLAMLQVSPFGGKSILTKDCYIQYIDYFQYLKDVFSGKASVTFSFSKSLGGSMVSLVGYYLSSPFNLLVVFFEKAHLDDFVFLITILKIGTCGATFSVFIQKRIPMLGQSGVIITSVAYAFTQYNVGQLSNINWLDGVYMLPIILLGIWEYITLDKKRLFYFSIALSVLFNWYTGYMNCIFAMFYYVYEKVCFEKHRNNLKIKTLFGATIRFAFLEILGVLLSCIFFIPIVMGQSSGRSFWDEGIFNFATNGRFVDIIRGFMIGTPNMGLTQTDSTITLFCSVLIFLFCISFFANGSINMFDRMAAGLLILVMVLSEYIQPIEHIWNGFKFANAFQFRFAYISIFTLIFVGAKSMVCIKEVNLKIWGGISAVCVLLFLVFHLEKPYSISALIIEIALIVYYFIWMLCYKRRWVKRRLLCFALIIVFLGEIVVNGYFVASDNYYVADGEYEEYSKEETELIESIKKEDNEFYRMEQITTRDKAYNNVTFFANESMAYGFYGLRHYSSSYDNTVANFLADVGYCKNEFPTFYSQPILTSDSLLGVKYLLSEKQYYGYEKDLALNSLNSKSEKEIYVNPYALSLAFECSEDVLGKFDAGDQNDIDNIGTENPFEYQNNIYSAILGEKVELYKKVTFSFERDANGVRFFTPAGNSTNVIYGYARSHISSIPLYIDKSYVCEYRNGWGNSGIFEIGSSKIGHEITFLSERGEETENSNEDDLFTDENFDALFYELDVKLFDRVIAQLKEKEMGIDEFTDTKIIGKYESNTNGYLLTTIPYTNDWEVTVNGKSVETQKGINAFLVIPIEAGENIIEFNYHVSGIVLGTIMSVLSIIVMVFWHIVNSNCRKKYKV